MVEKPPYKQVLDKVRSNVKIKWALTDKPYADLAIRISKTPPWFQHIFLETDIEYSTYSSRLISTFSMFATGARGMHHALYKKGAVADIRDSQAWWHEIAHDIDQKLTEVGYIRPEGEYSATGDEKWRQKVFAVVSDSGSSDAFWKYIKEGDYSRYQYEKEAFAETLAAYVELYIENVGDEDVINAEMVGRYPKLWPYFQELFLPQIQLMGEDAARSLDVYFSEYEWGIETHNLLCWGGDKEVITADIEAMSAGQRYFLRKKMCDAGLMVLATEHYADNKMLFKRDKFAALEQELLKHDAFLPAPKDQVRPSPEC